MRCRYRHYILANVRDLQVLFREFRVTLALFLCLVAAGTAILHGSYVDPDTGARLEPVEALYTLFCLIFVQPIVPLPREASLQALFFVVPILGLALIGEGIVRFGVLLFNKEARREEWQLALASTYSNHVVICGVGRLGFRIVEELHQSGAEIVAVELNRDNPFLAHLHEWGVPFILGNARDQEVLEQAGVARARTIIPCTENDLANLEIALDARTLNDRIRVVLRMFDPVLAKKVKEPFHIDEVFSTSTLGARVFAATVACGGQAQPLRVGGGRPSKLHVAEIAVGPRSRLAGMRIADVDRQFNLRVVVHDHKGEVDMRPAPDLVLAEGDLIAVLADAEPLCRLRKANGA